ncbi:hypothetical protein [Mycobacterium vicinigordonae]|uniref:Uncharacterized protein n=1 Tax=Mycobacterium vicinigordonae TaxID=1719132 RepID=A0A7D6E2V3_9MYCO|nr:hypothetical protein H0P51_19185 [Mycobacterium vicinigordonae]
MLSGARLTGYPAKWLDNAARRAVPPAVIVEIAGVCGLGIEALHLLGGFEEVNDARGKSFFLLPSGTGGDDARCAALLTYILNAGTDYGRADVGVVRDFRETPYSAAEVRRIMDRQRANTWSYARDVRFVDRNGGRLASTPNGILMGLGGSWVQRLFSQRGGTTWGDIFMVNCAAGDDPARLLREIITSRRIWHSESGGEAVAGVNLDGLLHHEERHSAQWAALGYSGMLRAYGWELLRELAVRKVNRLEEDAGLHDGGYR